MKAQMELMGIAIVVVLLSLLFVFVIVFVLPAGKTIGEDYRRSELAANFLNTLLETNAPECMDTDFSTLFQDCARNYDTGEIYCGELDSCEYIRQTLDKIFDNTFRKWKEEYFFQISRDLSNPSETQLFSDDPIFGSPCPGERGLKNQPIPLGGGETIHLSLYICSKTFK